MRSRSSAINTKMPRFYAASFTFLLCPYFSLAATWDDAAEEREAFAAMLQRVDSDALYGPQRLEIPLENKGDVLDREFADFRAHERSQRWVQDGRGGNARVLQHRIPEETSGSAETARNYTTAGADVVLAEALTNDPLPTSANCTWRYYDQPLNHFAGKTATSKFRYLQRACFYEGFLAPTTSHAFPVVFFYVGNESPLEVYINNTGLMWNLGQQLNGALIFAEHRYEGKSVPRNLNNTRGCLAYASSKQALADYALLVETLRATDARYRQSKFIAVGGSYGGMLAAWARQKYPQSFAGAIAGSAPIHGIPKIFPQIQMDASAKVVTRGLSKPGGLSTDFCAENYLGAWVLLSWWLGAGGRGEEERGNPGEEDAGKIIQKTMGLCTAPGPKDALTLLGYLQAAFFLLAEGNYPFPSNYITGAVGGNTSAKLPAWPMRAACSGLLDKKFLQIKRDRKAPAGVAKFELSVSSGGSSRSSSEEEISSTTAQEDQELERSRLLTKPGKHIENT